MKFIKENFDNSVERERKIVKFLEEKNKDFFDKQSSVNKWYEETFPDDSESVEDLSDSITFEKAATFVTPRGSEDRFYSKMGGTDSVVRERIFDKIAKLYNVSYEDVYNTWMGKPFTKLKDALDRDGVKYSLDESSDVEKVKGILTSRLTPDKKEIRAYGNDERMPKGFRFKSGTRNNGMVTYNGGDYAYAVVNGKVRVMTDKDAGWNWSETLYNDKLFESNQDENVFRVTYKASDKVFSSFMVRAKDKDDAIDKAIAYRKKKYNKDTDIVGAEKMTSDEVEDYKRRGMSLVESIDPEVKKMAEECSVEVFDGFDDFDISVTGKTSDIKEFLKRYYAYKGLDNKEECLKEDVEDATVEVKEEEVDIEPKKSPETDTDMSLANMLNLLIQDEWQAIDGYNGTIATIRSLEENPIDGNMNVDYEGITKILEDIAAEEMNHVGMLQKAMGTVSPNTSEIEGGEKEAEETLDDAGAEE